MPKQRITPGSGLNPTTGRVSVGTGDPFTPFTGNAAKARLENLGRSLAGLGREATGFYRQQAQRQDEEDAKAGRQAFLEALEEQGSVAEAIRQGRMRPGASKWFRWGVEAEAGAQAALRARDHFIATKGEALEEATTLEEFDQLASEAFDEYRETLDAPSEAFDNGFMPSYMAQLEQQRYSFATRIDGKLTQDFVDNFSANQYEQLQAARAYGASLASVGGTDVMNNPIAAAITADLDAKTRLNPKMAGALKEATAENLILLAMETGERGFLDLAKGIHVGPEEADRRTSLWTQYRNGENGFINATRQFEKLELARDQEAETALALADQKAFREGWATVATVLVNGDPTSPQTRRQAQQIINEVALVRPVAAEKMQDMLDSNLRSADVTDVQVFDYLRIGIARGDITAEHIANNRTSLTKEDLNLLLNQEAAQRRGEEDPAAKAILRESAVTMWQTRLERRFTDLASVGESDQIAAQNAFALFRTGVLANSERLRQLIDADPDDPRIEQIIRRIANEAAVTAARDADLQYTGLLNPEGPSLLVGEEESEPATIEEMEESWSREELAQMYALDQSGDLYAINPTADVRRLRQRWRASQPDIEFGSERMWNMIERLAQRKTAGE